MSEWTILNINKTDEISTSITAMEMADGVLIKTSTLVRGAGERRLMTTEELISKYGEKHPDFEQIVEYNYFPSESTTFIQNAKIENGEIIQAMNWWENLNKGGHNI